MNDRLYENKPTADILMTSMRAMGYSFESAVADVIDNSISAKATRIDILFPVDPMNCYIAICDNGTGMSKKELIDAMKYGSEQKRDGRSTEDLGRFGLGLKSASLSQCRKLTVISRKNGEVNAFIWDLDIIEKKRNWFMLQCTAEETKSIPCANYLDNVESGTVVIWEDFDIIKKSSGNVYSELISHLEETKAYLSLIFHRFINRPANSRIDIKVNKISLEGLDPFLENHNKTSARRCIQIPIVDSNGVEHMVSVQPYVLPFQRDLNADDKRLSGGIENYRSKQGFYIYRNERLIVWGTWFNRHRDELTKYARIKVDIPNSLDDIWGIDIKKQSAKIPSFIKKRLTRAVDEVMDTATKRQTYRGRKDNVDDSIDYIWDRISLRENQYIYHINRDSKIFDLIKNKVNDETWSRIDMVLEEIEKNIPYQQIYIDKSRNTIDESDPDDQRVAEAEEKARILIGMLCSTGIDRKSAIEKLFFSEPFNNFPSLKQKLLEE